jgi:hypothetical protein
MCSQEQVAVLDKQVTGKKKQIKAQVDKQVQTQVSEHQKQVCHYK